MAVGKCVGAGILLLMMIALISAGCSSVPEKGEEIGPQSPGFTDITLRDEFQQVSLTEAIDALNESGNMDAGSAAPAQIYYIRGESVDINGSARIWTIGAKRETQPFFFVFSAKGSEVVNGSYALSAHEIPIKSTITPADLFRQNQFIILNVTNGGKTSIDNLELQMGIYTLEVKSGNTTKMYQFDSVTGKDLIQE